MSKVQNSATLDEKTVQKVARGEVRRTPRRPRKAPERLVQPTFAAPLVHEKVWEQAKKILGTHGYTRWEVLDENTVVVR